MSGEENTPAVAAPTPQCQFFVQRKKRLCRMSVKPGRQYCGEHEPQPKTEAGQADKRIPCPNDPKHTCYASKLLKHLAICNARKTEQPPYIRHNINAPEEVETCPRRPLSAIPKDQVAAVIDKVNHLYAKHVEGHVTEEPPQPIHRTVLPEFSAADRAESSRRHLRQVSALLWSVERAGLAAERTCYVELGAGKGQLSYYAAHAWCGGGSRVLAVDRAPLRHKRDNKLRSAPPAPHTHPQPHPPAPAPRHPAAASHGFDSITSELAPGNGDPHNPPVATDKAFDSSGTSERHTSGNSDSSLKESRISELMDTLDDQNSTDTANSDINKISKESSIDGDSDNRSDSIKISEHLSDKPKSDSKHNSPTNNSLNLSNHNDISDLPENKKDVTANDLNKNSDNIELSNIICEQESVDATVDAEHASTALDEGSGSGSGSGGVAVRLRADLAHLALERVPVVAACDAVVGLAKHLCGVATDYALRCVAAPGVLHKARGAVLAACCHHRVQRAPYVAAPQLQELGIDAEDFNIMLGIVSWATCGDGRSRERRREGPPAPAPAPPPPPPGAPRHGLPRDAQEAVGRKAKALLDWGRVLWLRERGFDARLAYYVPREVSLENTVIIASKR